MGTYGKSEKSFLLGCRIYFQLFWTTFNPILCHHPPHPDPYPQIDRLAFFQEKVIDIIDEVLENNKVFEIKMLMVISTAFTEGLEKSITME